MLLCLIYKWFKVPWAQFLNYPFSHIGNKITSLLWVIRTVILLNSSNMETFILRGALVEFVIWCIGLFVMLEWILMLLWKCFVYAL